MALHRGFEHDSVPALGRLIDFGVVPSHDAAVGHERNDTIHAQLGELLYHQLGFRTFDQRERHRQLRCGLWHLTPGFGEFDYPTGSQHTGCPGSLTVANGEWSTISHAQRPLQVRCVVVG